MRLASRSGEAFLGPQPIARGRAARASQSPRALTGISGRSPVVLAAKLASPLPSRSLLPLCCHGGRRAEVALRLPVRRGVRGIGGRDGGERLALRRRPPRLRERSQASPGLLPSYRRRITEALPTRSLLTSVSGNGLATILRSAEPQARLSPSPDRSRGNMPGACCQGSGQRPQPTSCQQA